MCSTTRVGKEKVNGVRESSHFRLSTVTMDTGGESANIVRPDNDITILKEIRGGEYCRQDGEYLALIDEGLLIEPERGHPEQEVVENDISAHVMVVGIGSANDKANAFPAKQAVLRVAVEYDLNSLARAQIRPEWRKAIEKEVKEGGHSVKCWRPCCTLGGRLKTTFQQERGFACPRAQGNLGSMSGQAVD
jgi:hypothetical protein